MTWLDIVDSAIKIGLGAFIGGVFTFVLNKQAHKHEIEKEIIHDRRNTLKDIGSKFEIIHVRIIAFFLEYMREFDDKSVGKSRESNANDRLPTLTFFQQRMGILEQSIQELFALESILILYGYEKLSSVLLDYRKTIMSIYPSNRQAEAFYKNLLENIDNLNQLRYYFYEVAQECFRSKGSK